VLSQSRTLPGHHLLPFYLLLVLWVIAEAGEHVAVVVHAALGITMAVPCLSFQTGFNGFFFATKAVHSA
jgi:hypothetical protein